MGFKEWIIPQDRAFYELLEKQAQLAGQATDQFSRMIQSWNNLEHWRKQVHEIEHQADQVSHEIFDRLNKTFITPIDREDLARLTHALDDICDSIDAATARIAMLNLPQPTEPMREFIGVLQAQVREVDAAIRSLRKSATMKAGIPGHIIEIHRLENVADRILDEATSQLFRTNDAVQILKYKEIYEFLELATDRCEDVADVLQDILRKHS